MKEDTQSEEVVKKREVGPDESGNKTETFSFLFFSSIISGLIDSVSLVLTHSCHLLLTLIGVSGAYSKAHGQFYLLA